MAQPPPITQGITLHQMEVFEAVARHGSYTKAAEELYLTQPTVSIQVKQLSKTIGLPLFEMVGKRLQLTPSGETLLVTCRSILANLSSLDSTLESFKALQEGVIQVATVESAKTTLVHMLKPFMDSYPGLELSMRMGTHQDLLDWLQGNEDDFYVFGMPPALNGIEAFPCMEVPLQIIAHRHHPLAEQAVVTPQELAQESWILSEAGSASRHLLEEFFTTHRLNVRRRLDLSSYEAIKASIQAGLGIAALPMSTLSAAELETEFAVLPVAEFALCKQWHVAYPKGKCLSPGAAEFLAYLLRTLPAAAPGVQPLSKASTNS